VSGAWEMALLASVRADWLREAVRLVAAGGVAKSAGLYFDRGCPAPEYLTGVFDRLVWAGLVSVEAGDPVWAMRSLGLTEAGRAGENQVGSLPEHGVPGEPAVVGAEGAEGAEGVQAR